MPRPGALEQSLAQLANLRHLAASPAVLAGELAKFLAARNNHVVAKAADLAREMNVKSAESHLVGAFDRFIKNPGESDKGCVAIQAIVHALYELGADAEQLFLKAIRHVQKEGWGKPKDVAAETRGLAALGLVRMAYRDVMPLLVDLLVDPEAPARLMAARAIAYAGRDEGALLLRLKVQMGDPGEPPDDTAVLGECLVALGSLSRLRAVPFMQKYLDDARSTIAESAAIALGEMRHAEPLGVLLEQWERDRAMSTRHNLLLPIALSRLPAAIDFLVNLVASETEGHASAAVEALRIFRHDDAIRGRVESAIRARNFPRLTASFEKHFG
jgi:HEAT repeat protein